MSFYNHKSCTKHQYFYAFFQWELVRSTTRKWLSFLNLIAEWCVDLNSLFQGVVQPSVQGWFVYREKTWPGMLVAVKKKRLCQVAVTTTYCWIIMCAGPPFEDKITILLSRVLELANFLTTKFVENLDQLDPEPHWFSQKRFENFGLDWDLLCPPLIQLLASWLIMFNNLGEIGFRL